jgi:hypothetical protein
MSTETPAIPAAPQPKRKYKRRAKPKKASTQPQPRDEFAGLTATDCPHACGADGCVITARPICGHPMKGGVQAPLMRFADVVARHERACKALGMDKRK